MWDRDSGWDDDLLGRVSLVPTSGSVSKRLKLNHGTLTVELSATCAPSLQGAVCEQYAATPTYAGEEERGGPLAAASANHWAAMSRSHARL